MRADLWQTTAISGSFAYVVWPLAARRLLANLPLTTPVDEYISLQLKNERVRALVVQPVALVVPSRGLHEQSSGLANIM